MVSNTITYHGEYTFLGYVYIINESIFKFNNGVYQLYTFDSANVFEIFSCKYGGAVKFCAAAVSCTLDLTIAGVDGPSSQ